MGKRRGLVGVRLRVECLQIINITFGFNKKSVKFQHIYAMHLYYEGYNGTSTEKTSLQNMSLIQTTKLR